MLLIASITTCCVPLELFSNCDLSYPFGIFPLVKITSLSDERLNPEIVTSPSDPTTSSPSQLASYTKVSASAEAATESESISVSYTHLPLPPILLV